MARGHPHRRAAGGRRGQDATVAAGFLDRMVWALCKLGFTMIGVLTDNGPEFVGRAFRNHAAELGQLHDRIPPRSPNHNSVCERFRRTVLHELYRPHFHRGRVQDIALLDRALEAWLCDYNEHRPKPRRLHERTHRPRR